MLGASEVSPKMFENPFFDFFSRTPWYIVPLVYGPIVAWLAWSGFAAGVAWYMVLAQAVLGFGAWTLTEYWLHRTFFHWKPDTWWGPKLHFIVHGVHHDWHRDPYRLVMPPAVSLALCVTFYAVFSALGVLASPWIESTWVWGGYAGFVLGYLTYDVVHYVVHHAKLRGGGWLMQLRKHHMAHHHNPKDKDRKYGVSTLVWDRVFGTL